jgi:hypothetical protein
LSKDYQQVLSNPTPQTATRFDALVGYSNDKIRLGVEYLDATDWNVVTSTHKDQSEGYSVFGSYNFVPQWSVFGRYDELSPSQKLASAERYNYYNLGVAYEPVKYVDLGLVFKHEGVTHAAANGYTDATTTLAPNSTGAYNPAHPLTTGTHQTGDYNEIGLFSQFKF